MITRRLAVFLLAAALALPAARAQDNVQPELSLQECINRALRKNFDLEIGRYNPQIAKDAIDAAKGAFDSTFVVTGSRGKNTVQATFSSPSYSADSTTLQAGVTQQLTSGTTLSVSSNLARNATNPFLFAPNPAFNADFTFAIKQSLLAGFGTTVNKAAINRARIGLDIANLNFRAQVLTVIQQTENAYYNLVLAREQLAVFKTSFDLADRLFNEAQIRRDTGVATDLDVLSAQVGVANARRNVLLAKQTAQDQQDALLALIGQFELGHDLGPVRFPEVETATPVFASAYELAKQSQPDYLASVAAIGQYKLDTVVAKDATKPDLSVGAAVGVSGRNNSTGNAYNDAFNRQNNSWQVNFNLTYPWGQRSNKARYRQSVATLNREQVRLQQLEQNIEVQVRSAVRSVETNVESVKIATLAAKLSEQQYELEKARFDAGQSTSYRVLQAQTDLATARVNHLQAQVALNTAIAALHRVEGSSLQRYSITLP